MRKLTVSIAASLYDRHGRLIRKYRPRAAHSFLAQFIEYLNGQMSQASTEITDKSGVERTYGPIPTSLKLNGAAGDTNLGILIGSGTDAVDIDDYQLQTKITSDLTVSAHTFVLSYPTPTSRRVAISRTFTNALASPMPIEEVALYTQNGGGYFFVLDRTLYSVAIPASSSLELTYRITVSV